MCLGDTERNRFFSTINSHFGVTCQQMNMHKESSLRQRQSNFRYAINSISKVFFCAHDNGISPTANATACYDYFRFIYWFYFYYPPHLCHCYFLPFHAVGCGGGRRRKFHHTVLYPNGWRGLPHPDRDTGYLLSRGPISQRCNHEAPQTSHFWPCHMPCHGVSHQSLLPGRHTGLTQGKYTAVCMCVSMSFCVEEVKRVSKQ